MKDCANRTCNFCNLQMFHETPWTIATGHQISKEVDDEERQALPGTASKQCSTDHEGNTWQRMFPCSHSIHHVPQWYQWYPQIQVKAPALKLVSRHVMSISGMNCWWRVCRRPVISTHQSFPNRPTRDATERTTVDKPEMSMSLTDTSVRDAILRNNTRKRNKCIIIAIIIHGDKAGGSLMMWAWKECVHLLGGTRFIQCLNFMELPSWLPIGKFSYSLNCVTR